jgi:tetratricopeptide (TPR) repeat protein
MEKESNFVKFDGTLEDVLTKEEDYIFLAGAGISMDPPSKLPSARTLINSLIEYMCPPEILKENLLNLKYELLIEVFRNEVDPELKIIDFFSLPKYYNSIHHFLAQMILKEYYVMTTNFDQLIEYAILSIQSHKMSESPTNDFKVAITENDYNNIKESDSRVLFKLHGSNKNVITGEDTKDSIVTTMDSIGKGMKNQEQLFVLPLHIHSMLERICKGKTLVFIGYGGGDGLDVLPELARIENIQKIIWIEHFNSSTISIEKYQLTSPFSYQELPKISQLSGPEEFMKYRIFHHKTEIYKIKGNTSKIVDTIRNLLKLPEDTSSSSSESTKELVNLNLQTWLESQFPSVIELKTYFLAGKLFRVSLDYETSFKYFMHGNDLFNTKYSSVTSAPEEDIQTIAEIKVNIGLLYTTVRNYKMADHFFRSAYYLFQKINNDRGMGDTFHNIGLLQTFLKKPKEAINNFQKAVSMYEYVDYKYGIANTWKELGLTYQEIREYEKGFEFMEKAYSLLKEIGDFMGMGDQLNNMGLYYNLTKDDPEKAMQYYEKAGDIYKQLGFIQGVATVRNNIALIYSDKENYKKALVIFEEIFEIDKQRGDPLNMGSDLRNIAKMYRKLGKLEKSLENFENAYKILIDSYPDHQITKIVANELNSLKSSLQ